MKKATAAPGTPGLATANRPAPYRANTEGERLSKRVMALRQCSRSEAENLIEAGWVRVDDVVIENPATRVSNATVTVDPKAQLEDLSDVTIILNKPPGYRDGTEDGAAPQRGVQEAIALLKPDNHWSKDPSGIRLLQRHLRKLQGMVPLETGASGLVVFTQDWRRVRKLEEDHHSMEHELMLDVQGALPEEAPKLIARALKNGGDAIAGTRFSVSSETPAMSQLRLAVKGAHPGLAAYLCAQAGLEIRGLRRIRLGRIALGALPVGQWRYLSDHERF